MKKGTICIFIFMLLAVFALGYGHIGYKNTESLFIEEKNDITSYLKAKYDEDVRVLDVIKYDTVISNCQLIKYPDIEFKVVYWINDIDNINNENEYRDDFLQKSLENDAKKIISSIMDDLADNIISVQLGSAMLKETEDNLYELYCKLGRPAEWEDISSGQFELQYIDIDLKEHIGDGGLDKIIAEINQSKLKYKRLVINESGKLIYESP